MTPGDWLLPGECLHDLQRGGLFIIQPERGFRFSTDSVLLADFCRAKKGERAADMGTGSGVIPLLLAARQEGLSIDAFELSEAAADRARRSAAMNGLSDAICVYHADVRDAAKIIGYGSVSLVVTNPPYLQSGEGLVSPEPERALARGGSGCGIGEWTTACAAILKNGGRFAAVFPATGFLKLADAMRASGIEPKRARFVAARPEKTPKLVLLEGMKGGGQGLLFLPVLYTHEADGSYSREMLRIYGEESVWNTGKNQERKGKEKGE